LDHSDANGVPQQVFMVEEKTTLSIIVPCFNEEAVLREMHHRLISVVEEMDLNFEVIYVDDGSSDGTAEILKELHRLNPRAKVLRFSRNFGHQFAITAGLHHASGDAVVLIDADLQDPPEKIKDMVAEWQNGYDVVYGQRIEREGESRFKLWTAKLFYRLINRLSDADIPLDSGDFRLMDRKVVDMLNSMSERDRFIRGMVSWLGFRQTALPYRRERRFAGDTKYPLRSMICFAMDGILSFSLLPLKIATVMGFTASGFALIGILYALFMRLFTTLWVTGWTLLIIAVLFMGGVQLICLGIIGEYLGRSYLESKRRPLYSLHECLGFENHKSPGPRSWEKT
jgi:glycosyltransferase involved in cell wall biosynthesis